MSGKYIKVAINTLYKVYKDITFTIGGLTNIATGATGDIYAYYLKNIDDTTLTAVKLSTAITPCARVTTAVIHDRQFNEHLIIGPRYELGVSASDTQIIWDIYLR